MAFSSIPNNHHKHLFHHSLNYASSSSSPSSSPKFHYFLNNPKLRSNSSISYRITLPKLTRFNGFGKYGFSYSLCCLCKSTDSEVEKVSVQEEEEEEKIGAARPPFDIHLAVLLAGFAFEAYTTPPDNLGKREVDAADTKTVYLSESFLRETYDGKLLLKLKKGFNFPAMDPWGTSDPYVVLQLDDQVVKSKVKWGTIKPTWNEDITLYIKQPHTKKLQIAAWDANLVTPHKRMGNAVISLDKFSDGTLHEVLVELEGMGGGGKVQLEVKYMCFDDIDEENTSWKIPFISEFLREKGIDSAIKNLTGYETVQAREFAQFAFGQLSSLNDADLWKGWTSKDVKDTSLNDASEKKEGNVLGDTENESASLRPTESVKSVRSDTDFWQSFAGVIDQNVIQKLGISMPGNIKWDVFDLLNKSGLELRKIAEAGYVESGLATKSVQDDDDDNGGASSGSLTISKIQLSLPDIKKATEDVLRQTDSVLGALMVLTAVVSKSSKDAIQEGNKEDSFEKNDENELSRNSDKQIVAESSNGLELDEKKAEEMKALFVTAESAMEAWAMLATSLGHPSFIKSEFEKLCFLDNASTDTQVAIWRDPVQRRLVVAFRGTEQGRWKDLITDLMAAPAGLNPERIGGDFKQEVQVHSGFLSAYDSVRTRIISLIKLSIGDGNDDIQGDQKWHVYLTGHSLGGALATLLALELASSQLVKRGVIQVTMYNFGSPRVGNKNFAEIYNEKVRDSWRVVNHRDIIPTIPRLMGYCHVDQPVYLTTGDIRNSLVESMELSGDGYGADILGESTPDVIVSEFMKGEKELIEKLLQTEINIFRSIRDGSALMQHMEDFYYVSLLENVRSNYRTVKSFQATEEGNS